MLRGYFKDISSVFQGCLRCVSEVLHESFKSVLQVLQKYLMTDSRFFQACFWEEWTDDIMDNKKILKLCYII